MGVVVTAWHMTIWGKAKCIHQSNSTKPLIVGAENVYQVRQKT